MLLDQRPQLAPSLYLYMIDDVWHTSYSAWTHCNYYHFHEVMPQFTAAWLLLLLLLLPTAFIHGMSDTSITKILLQITPIATKVITIQADMVKMGY
jgi:hypothetical protein